MTRVKRFWSFGMDAHGVMLTKSFRDPTVAARTG
jgi:hypothetical protein